MESLLTMDFSRVSKKRKRIIISVLALSIVTIILGLGLGLGLQLERCQTEVVPASSCRARCFQPFDAVPGCQCDHACVAYGNCCYDFHATCLQATQQWECNTLRCGETRLAESRCHCSADCLVAGDCCTNYKHVCHGEAEWVEDPCVDLAAPQCPASFRQQPLLLVSLDGLRAEYLQTWATLMPTLDKLRRCGTFAPYMQASFPTKTFPNHYTIVTGLYPESNGLIDNDMYDPVFDASFSLSGPEKDNPRWYLGQPIWHTARYQGLKSGTYFWPGSDVKINGSFPDLYQPYDGKVPFEERVATVLKWLQLPDDQRPDFYTLYLEEPDKSGHKFGPVSGGVIEAMQGVDRIIGQLMNGLKQINLHRCLNIIIVADHGMEATSCDRKEILQELVGSVSDYWVTEGTFGRIRAKNKNTVLDSAGLVANMTVSNCKKPAQKITPYLKAHLPKRLHFANSRRIEDITVLVSPKWLFERSRGSLTFCSGGAHGYDNDVDSMHAMFVSYGPKFLSRTEVEPFSNTELYNLMCDVLGVSPAENNGTHGSLNHLLRQPVHRPTRPAEQSGPGSCPLTSLEPEDALGCSCPALNGSSSINSRLNLTDVEEAAILRRHAPFGRPAAVRPGQHYCVLVQPGYVSGYSQGALMPLWTSYTLERPATSAPLPPVTKDCLRADVRVQAAQSPRCDPDDPERNVTHAFLHPPNLNSTAEEQFDSLLMTNVVPMYPAFHKIWHYFHNALLTKYALQYNGINVVVGPVFDHNHDGLYDASEQIQWSGPIPIPTHYFAVLTSCGNLSHMGPSCLGELQTVSFLLPHRPDNSETCKFLAAVLLLLGGVPPAAAQTQSHTETFRYRDPATGRTLECHRCPPGKYLRAPCTATQQSDCATCPPGSFTELWNHIGKCLRCGTCEYNREVTRECAPEHDCECECREGYYLKRDYDMCLKHSECPSGHGVISKGTAHRDTVCHACAPGFFSDCSSAELNCSAHASCEALGLHPVLKGSSWHDSLCVSCTELWARDAADFLREILPAFFQHHQMPIKRLQRVVHSLLDQGREYTAGLQRRDLVAHINDWVRGATEQELRELPGRLSRFGVTGLSGRLQAKLTRIDQQVNQLLAQPCSAVNVILAE